MLQACLRQIGWSVSCLYFLEFIESFNSSVPIIHLSQDSIFNTMELLFFSKNQYSTQQDGIHFIFDSMVLWFYFLNFHIVVDGQEGNLIGLK